MYGPEGLAYGDFRQEWNHEGWYVTYLVYRLHPDLRDYPMRRKTADQSERQPWQERFRTAYKQVIVDFREQIHQAVTEFETVRLYPFKEARDFLNSLKLTGSLELYIVSEGNRDTQWRKLCNTGLSEFFTEEHLLTTGDAVESVTVRQSLRETQGRLDAEAEGIKGQRTRLLEFIHLLNQLESSQLIVLGTQIADSDRIRVWETLQKTYNEQSINLVKDIVALDEKLETIRRRIWAANFVEHVIEAMGQKVETFYACAMRAILRDPAAPRSQIKHFERLLEPSSAPRRLKFAMIGDRQSKDIEPPSELLSERIITIRLNSLKHSITEPVEARAEHPPRYVVSTLAEAKAILLAKRAWEVSCATDPPLFNWKISRESSGESVDRTDFRKSQIDLSHILYGCKLLDSEFRYIGRVCAGILVENLARWDRDEQDHVLEPFLDRNGGLENEVRDRACLLCALVRTGSLYYEPLAHYQFRVAEQLVRDEPIVGPDTRLEVDRTLRELGENSDTQTRVFVKNWNSAQR